MAFIKGQSGHPQGRPKGSKNSFTRLKARQVYEILNQRGCNPFEILADIAMDETVSIHARVTAASELCQYVESKLKSIELTGKGNSCTFVFDGLKLNQAPMIASNEQKAQVLQGELDNN